MMDRRIFLATVAGLLAAPLAVEAQQAGKAGISTCRPQCERRVVTTEGGIE